MVQAFCQIQSLDIQSLTEPIRVPCTVLSCLALTPATDLSAFVVYFIILARNDYNLGKAATGSSKISGLSLI